MRKTILFIGIMLIASLMLTACSKDANQPTDTVPTPITETSASAGSGTSITGSVVAVPVEEDTLANIRVQELKALGQKVNSYKYNYKSIYHDNEDGLLVQEKSYTAIISGNLVRKSYGNSIKFNKDFSYFDAYLDTSKKVAYGTCAKATITCTSEHYHKAYQIDYYKEELDVTPIELISKLDDDAKVIGERDYNNRKVTMVDSKRLEGNYQRLYVDNFYGLPLKQIIFIYNANNEEVVLRERYFDLIAAGPGSVKLSEVIIPSEFTIMN
jgi:hypothetical protein